MCQEKFDADLYLKFSKYGSKVLGSGNAPVRGLILSVPDILDLVLFSTSSALIGHVSTHQCPPNSDLRLISGNWARKF